MRNVGAVVLFASLGFVLGGCEHGSIHDPGPLQVEVVQTGGTLEVGEPVQFESSAQGDALALLVTRFGDGAADTLVGHGARWMAHDLEHVYGTAGEYDVEAWVFTFQGDSLSHQISLDIQDEADPAPSASR
jgi:hypothetical protein